MQETHTIKPWRRRSAAGLRRSLSLTELRSSMPSQYDRNRRRRRAVRGTGLTPPLAQGQHTVVDAPPENRRWTAIAAHQGISKISTRVLCAPRQTLLAHTSMAAPTKIPHQTPSYRAGLALAFHTHLLIARTRRLESFVPELTISTAVVQPAPIVMAAGGLRPRWLSFTPQDRDLCAVLRRRIRIGVPT